jgi:hypothetical protein
VEGLVAGEGHGRLTWRRWLQSGRQFCLLLGRLLPREREARQAEGNEVSQANGQRDSSQRSGKGATDLDEESSTALVVQISTPSIKYEFKLACL